MQIFYYKRRDRVANFGDELNTWLWQQYLPEAIAQEDDSVLVGLGTLLNNLLPQRLGNPEKVFIFSTGAGYEKPLQSIRQNWHIYCVRGPLTAKHFNLPGDLAITDGGILLRRLVSPQPSSASASVAFIPHVHHATFARDVWKSVCQTVGFRYIDPTWPVEQVISAIQNSKLLLAEAMHGAITADALGVPWIPLTTSPRVLSFKWQDWCASIQQPYRPAYLPPLTPQYPRYGRGLRSGRRSAWHWGWTLAQGNGTLSSAQMVGQSKIQIDRLATILEKIATKRRPILSDRTHLETLTQALEEKLAQLRQDASL
ncbi:MAG: polysaccharide pyruvyl transferase family protein [Leptolyngbya sp. SIO1D8]|nr:polysaccharide pyruvyl transferase family protein [Leptolyngbya sp. SIO1D8]